MHFCKETGADLCPSNTEGATHSEQHGGKGHEGTGAVTVQTEGEGPGAVTREEGVQHVAAKHPERGHTWFVGTRSRGC